MSIPFIYIRCSANMSAVILVTLKNNEESTSWRRATPLASPGRNTHGEAMLEITSPRSGRGAALASMTRSISSLAASSDIV
jgi:hypothetical protein